MGLHHLMPVPKLIMLSLSSEAMDFAWSAFGSSLSAELDISPWPCKCLLTCDCMEILIGGLELVP